MSGAARGWRAYLMDGSSPSNDKVVFCCPRCALAEFGPLPEQALVDDE
ncbi:MAG: hypothetical protein ACXVRK_03925 [Gaiellaceae bacterium]